MKKPRIERCGAFFYSDRQFVRVRFADLSTGIKCSTKRQIVILAEPSTTKNRALAINSVNQALNGKVPH
jgi:hypothetical protein